MSQSVDQELISELEAAVERQQSAVTEGRAAILETIRELQDALNQLEQRQTAITENAESLSEETASRLDALRQALDESQEDGLAAQQEIKAARARIEELEQALQAKDASVAERLEAAEGQIAQLQRENEQQAQLLVEAEKAYKRLRKIEQAYKEQCEALQVGQAAKRRVAELETTVEEYRNAAQAEQARVAELQETVESLRQSEAEAREELAAMKEQEGPAAEEQIAAAEQALQEAESRASQLESELEQTNERVKELEQNYGSHDEELATREAALEDADERYRELDEKRAALEQELEDLRARARETAESERSLRETFDAAEAELAMIRPDAERVSELESSLATSENEANELREKVVQLEQDLAEFRSKGAPAQLAEQLAAALREREAAEDEARSLRRQLAELEQSAITDDVKTEPDPGTATDVEPDSSFEPLEIDDEDAKRMMGEIFVKTGVITDAQLDEALEAQKQMDRPTRHLGAILVSMGYADEEEVAQVVARQRELEYLHLEAGTVDANAAHLIAGRLAEKHTCIPVRDDGADLVVAMENPLDLIAIEDIERATERHVQPAVATPTAIKAAIARVYASEHQEV